MTEKDWKEEASKRTNGKVTALSAKKHVICDRIPTGSLALDEILEGGIPQGRITEIYGWEASGKTTLTLHVIAEAQKIGKRCLFIDVEHGLDVPYATKLGVDADELLHLQPDSGEEVFESIRELACLVDLIVIDSVAALVPIKETQEAFDKPPMASQARLMSKGLRIIAPVISKENCAVIFINQLRNKIGMVWGSPNTTPGGKALPFYASVRLEIKRTKQVKKGDTILGSLSVAEVKKSKVSIPFKKAEFMIRHGKGIAKVTEILNLAVEKGLILKKKAGYYYLNIKETEKKPFAQGQENAVEYLKDNSETLSLLQEGILEHMRKTNGE